MIVAPSRRLWLYPTPDGALEILVLGDEEAVAPMYARIRSLAERWPGFDRVSAVAQAGAVLGVRTTLSPRASHLEPVREGLRAFRSRSEFDVIAWDLHDQGGPTGVVGTW